MLNGGVLTLQSTPPGGGEGGLRATEGLGCRARLPHLGFVGLWFKLWPSNTVPGPDKPHVPEDHKPWATHMHPCRNHIKH